MPASVPRSVDTLAWLCDRDPVSITAWRDPVIESAGLDPRGA